MMNGTCTSVHRSAHISICFKASGVLKADMGIIINDNRSVLPGCDSSGYMLHQSQVNFLWLMVQ